MHAGQRMKARQQLHDSLIYTDTGFCSIIVTNIVLAALGGLCAMGLYSDIYSDFHVTF